MKSRDYLNQTLTSANGLFLRFKTDREAKAFANACYSERYRDQARSRKSLKPGETMYGKSVYDKLSIYRNNNTVRIEVTYGPIEVREI
jgi:hypothetical protein